MSFILKTVRDRAFLGNIKDSQCAKEYCARPSFPSFGRHVEFWQKWKMSFIDFGHLCLKTVRDRLISGSLGTSSLGLLKNLYFSEYWPPS